MTITSHFEMKLTSLFPIPRLSRRENRETDRAIIKFINHIDLPGDSEGTVRASSQTDTVNHHTLWRLSTVLFLILFYFKQEKREYHTKVSGFAKCRTEPTSTVSEADAFSARPTGPRNINHQSCSNSMKIRNQQIVSSHLQNRTLTT